MDISGNSGASPERREGDLFRRFHEDPWNMHRETTDRVTETINNLTVTLPGGGYLHNLAWNMRNRYLSHPGSKFDAEEVQMLVEGFLAEVDSLKSSPPEA